MAQFPLKNVLLQGTLAGTPTSGTLDLSALALTVPVSALRIGTSVQAYDPDLTTWAGITPGTGVGAALAINTGSAGAFVTFNGAGGTPSSLTLTNATGLPLTSGVTGTLPIANGGTAATTSDGALRSFFPSSTVFISEDFPNNQTGDGTNGTHGWRGFSLSGSGSTSAAITQYGGAWGMRRILTAAASGNDRVMGLGSTGAPSNVILAGMLNTVIWESWFRFAITDVTSVHFTAGFTNNLATNPTTSDRIIVRFDTASDTTIKLETRASGTSTTADTTVAPSAATFYKARIWSESAGVIKCRIYSAAGAALGSEVSSSTNIPSTEMDVTFYVKTSTTAVRSADVDFFQIIAQTTR